VELHGLRRKWDTGFGSEQTVLRRRGTRSPSELLSIEIIQLLSPNLIPLDIEGQQLTEVMPWVGTLRLFIGAAIRLLRGTLL
jgi:hypothetical protein